MQLWINPAVSPVPIWSRSFRVRSYAGRAHADLGPLGITREGDRGLVGTVGVSLLAMPFSKLIPWGTFLRILTRGVIGLLAPVA